MAIPDRADSRETSKLEIAARQLSALARELGPGAKLPRCLTHRCPRHAAALEDLEGQGVITRRHGVGIYVSERLHHRNIMLLCNPAFFQGEEVSPFWNMLVQQARERAAGNAEDLALHFTRPDSVPFDYKSQLLTETVMAEVRGGRVHGILGVGLRISTVEWITARRIPFVAFAGPGPCLVYLDSVASVQMGVEVLAAQGCRRIALWSSVSPRRVICRQEVLRRPTLTAFPAILDASGIPFDPELIRTNAHLCPDYPAGDEDANGYTEMLGMSQQEQGRQTAREVFGPDADPRLCPDGIVCTEDTMMQGALPVLTRLGVRIGEEVHIATHANAGSSALFGYEDVLIRMEVDPARLVREMYTLLEDQMDGRMPETPKRVLPPTLRLPDTNTDGRS
jgi:DNA-binding LacI/PurR family transcriptional regulator